MSNQLLTRTYQLLLHAYPRETRTERGQVELDTLLAVSKPNQRLPRIAEARAICQRGHPRANSEHSRAHSARNSRPRRHIRGAVHDEFSALLVRHDDLQDGVQPKGPLEPIRTVHRMANRCCSYRIVVVASTDSFCFDRLAVEQYSRHFMVH